MKRSLLSLLCLISPLTLADASKGQVAHFADIGSIVEQWKTPSTTLVVMDDDDTLTMMPCQHRDQATSCQYLGGPAWYSWQEALVKNRSPSPYRVAQDMEELYSISGFLLAINNMAYTEDTVPWVLSQLQGQGVRLLVETARSTDELSATANQFDAIYADPEQTTPFSQLIAQNSLAFGDPAIASLPSPYTPCNQDKYSPIVYQQGVMLVVGQNKGEMLQCMLKRYQQANGGQSPITHILFIDDTPKNVEDMYQAFKDQDDYTVAALHYSGLEKHKAALTHGPDAPQLQKLANTRWLAIRNTLDLVLKEPSFEK